MSITENSLWGSGKKENKCRKLSNIKKKLGAEFIKGERDTIRCL